MSRLRWSSGALILTLATSAVTLAQDDPIVARINGAELTYADILDSAASLPEAYRNQIDALFPALRERLIGLELLAQAGAEAGLAEDPEVMARVAAYQKEAIRNVYVERYLAEQIKEEELQKRYDAYVAANPAVEEVRARHILVPTREEAVAIIAQLDGGADFATLAQEHSTDGAAANGGDLGYFVAEEMVEPFAKAAFSIAPGAYSKEPVETEFGFHVVKVEDKRTRQPATLEELRRDLESQLAGDIMAKKIAELTEAAEIELFNSDGTPVAE